MISNENAFRARLKKEISQRGLLALISEGITKGFPDLLLIDEADKAKSSYFLELKFCESDQIEKHKKLVKNMQLYWLRMISRAFLLVYVPAHDLFMYEIDIHYQLQLKARCKNTDELLQELRK